MEAHESTDPTFAILKHNNACGVATRKTLSEAYNAALAGDPISAFGDLIANRPIDIETARQIHELFCEVVIAPSFDEKSLTLLKNKKNIILLAQKQTLTHKVGSQLSQRIYHPRQGSNY